MALIGYDESKIKMNKFGMKLPNLKKVDSGMILFCTTPLYIMFNINYFNWFFLTYIKYYLL